MSEGVVVCDRVEWYRLAHGTCTSPRATRDVGAAGACTTATAVCTEWVQVGGGPGRSLIYRTHSLDKKNDRIRTALIMVHGTNRNADEKLGTKHGVAIVSECGHNDRCVYTTTEVLPVIFPKKQP